VVSFLRMRDFALIWAKVKSAILGDSSFHLPPRWLCWFWCKICQTILCCMCPKTV